MEKYKSGFTSESYDEYLKTQRELNQLLEHLVRRLLRLLTRRGYLVEDQGQTYLDDESEETALSNLQAAATSYRIGLGPRRGKKVLTLRTIENKVLPA